MDNAIGLAKTEAIYFPSMALLIGLSTLITIMVGALEVVHNPTDASKVGTIVEFVLYIQMLTFPVSAIGWTASMTQRAAVSQRRINEFLLHDSLTKNKNNNPPFTLKGSIEFKNVSFTYAHTGVQAIKNFNLKINKGEKIALIGKTGSGKTTLAQLLLNMYQLNSGTILYDGVDLEKINNDDLRNQISYVPQDVFLFSDSIKNNISFGVEKADMETIKKAAVQASIHHEIEKFEKGYETLIGERGVTLSGGQKQRISIARALIKQPKMVIFDDCLSAVDAKTENEVIGNLYTYLQDKTAIIITHRIFSLFDFDKIIVLDDGAIVEQGKHSELLKKEGYYAKMYAIQQQQSNI